MNTRANAPEVLFRTEIVRGYDAQALEQILDLEKKCFPKEWLWDDAREYYAERLRDERSTNILVFAGQEELAIGYLLARPLSDVYGELKGSREEGKDDALNNDFMSYYIETASVDPQYQGRNIFAKLLREISKEVRRIGLYETLSAHARTRVGSNASAIIQKIFPDFLEKRKVDSWCFGGNEPYEYIKWKV